VTPFSDLSSPAVYDAFLKFPISQRISGPRCFQLDKLSDDCAQVLWSARQRSQGTFVTTLYCRE
jgi:hypothetical protein